MRRILCLYLPLLPIQSALQNHTLKPADLHQPIAFIQEIDRTKKIAWIDPRAAHRGLRQGMTCAEAQAVIPDLILLPHNPQHDADTLRSIAAWALRFSPLVEPLEPDTLLLDISGCQRLFGGDETLLRRARRDLAATSWGALSEHVPDTPWIHAVITETIGAACALAWCGQTDPPVIPVGQIRDALHPLPVNTLRLPPTLINSLTTLGLTRISDLLALPRDALHHRFGDLLIRRLQEALGEIWEPLNAFWPAEIPQATWQFEDPTHDLRAIDHIARRLLHTLVEAVVSQGLALRRVDCVLEFETGPPRVVGVELSRASGQTHHIQSLLESSLHKTRPRIGVQSITLLARHTTRWRGRQGELFEPGGAGEDEALGCLVDRCIARLGRDAVVQAELRDDYQPEQAYRYVPARLSTPSSSDEEAAAPSIMDPVRPLRLFSRPQPIRVLALVPDGPPTWFSHAGEAHQVAWAVGPERIETGWWRGPDVRRDYFQISDEAGREYWVFRDDERGGWYVHGIFV